MPDQEEPFGTTPIPTSESSAGSASSDGKSSSVDVTLDIWNNGPNGPNGPSGPNDSVQQPQTQQIAVYEATPNEECINGSLLDVNQHFVVYTVKNGLIRVLHRHSALRSLLRGHHHQVVTDIRFFLDGDVLATIGHSPETGVSTLIVWRVFEQSPDIQSERLLEVVSPKGSTMHRLIWHPFNPNQVWVLHSIPSGEQVATLVETTQLQTTPHPDTNHPVCHWYSPSVVMEGAVQLSLGNSKASVADLVWSGRDTRHVLTVHQTGEIVLWDLKQTDNTFNTDNTLPTTVDGVTVSRPKALRIIHELVPQSRCLFLPHENAVRLHNPAATAPLTTCFVTASRQNTVLTIWSSFAAIDDGALPTKLQVIRLAQPSPSYVLEVCFGPAPQEASPPSCFLVWADRHAGKLLAIHVASQWNDDHTKALVVGADYVVPFQLKHPVYSWCVVCAPTQDISEDELANQGGLIFDMKLFSYQQKVVQCLTLTSYMCLPPEHGYTDATVGVTVQAIEGVRGGGGIGDAATTTHSDGVAAVVSELDDFDEDYDVDDEEDDDEEEPTIQPALPIGNKASSNPFANWLGAIVGTSAPTPTAAITTPPMPAPPPPSALPPPGLGASGSAAAAAAVAPPGLLNPMDLQAPAPALAPTPAVAKTTSSRSATPNTNNKSKDKSNKIPKTGGRNNNNNNNNKKDNKSPFPDGAKIQILKREDKLLPPATNSNVVVSPSSAASAGHSVAVPVPLPVGPSFVDHASLPAVPALAVAATSDPNLEALLRRVVSQEMAKQPPPVVKAAKAPPLPDIQGAVEQALTSQLVPAVHKVIQESLSSFGRPLQSSMDRLGQQGVRVDAKELQTALDLETPIKAALADAMRNIFIPAMESLTAQILQQATPPPPPPPPVPAPDVQTQRALQALTHQFVAMGAHMEIMTKELVALKASATGAAGAAGGDGRPRSNGSAVPPPPPQPQAVNAAANQLEIARQEINALLLEKQYQTAFTKAVSTTSADMAVWACSRANVQAVLGGTNGPSLSQPILLCLMQQLGAALPTTRDPQLVGLELEWLQEIALTLNPTDVNIQRHVPSVLTQLRLAINAKTDFTNQYPQLRRPLHMLLQVIRGMQVG